MEKVKELLQVGELAKAVGKTVRALHLYEELGLVLPYRRSEGGFRLYRRDAISRIRWILKLQSIGFTLSEIQGFIHDFAEAESGRAGSSRVDRVFREKLAEVRQQIAELCIVEDDLSEAIAYLDGCNSCSVTVHPNQCSECGHVSHREQDAPPLFAGLSDVASGGRTANIVPLPLRSQSASKAKS